MIINNAKDIGFLVKERREKLKLTQLDLAGLCSVGNRFIVELEKGKPSIQFDKALYVAKMVGIQISVE